MHKMNWSKWYPLKELERSRFSTVPKSKGVYQIRCVADEMPVIIPRAGGEDKEGILYR